MLVAWSTTMILTQEVIFSWLRKLIPYKPFTCSVCMSVWVGFGLSFFFPSLISLYISWFVYAMLSYAMTRIMNKVLDDSFILD